MRERVLRAAFILAVLGGQSALAQDRDTKVRNDRKSFTNNKDWIYNDLANGIRLARTANKPLFVVFRCIPCEACQEFDDDVARRDEKIRDLLDQYVCVRIPTTNAMDLSHFQFDFDLSFAVFLMDADMTIYGRYGTRSERPEEEDISLEGLRKAMAKALEMHRAGPSMKATLAGKQVKPSRYSTPLDLPPLTGKYRANLDYEGKVARSCIHCHQIRDAERLVLRDAGERFPDQVLYPYPDPEVVGLKLDPTAMARIEKVSPDSAADRDGFMPGDEIVTLDGQPLLSIADFQWVLHNAPATAKLPAQARRDGRLISLTLTLKDGWRRGNISWRPTSWQLRQMGFGGMKLSDLDEQGRRAAQIKSGRLALKIDHVGEYGEHAVAKRAGLKKGDIIVSFDGRDEPMTESQLFDYTLRQKHRGDKIAVQVIRNGSLQTFTYSLP
jgi:serine protease Do